MYQKHEPAVSRRTACGRARASLKDGWMSCQGTLQQEAVHLAECESAAKARTSSRLEASAAAAALTPWLTVQTPLESKNSAASITRPLQGSAAWLQLRGIRRRRRRKSRRRSRQVDRWPLAMHKPQDWMSTEL